MKKSARILVIAALVVSAIVFTGCKNLMKKISGAPDGTYVYAWYDSEEDNGSLMFTFDGNDFIYTTNVIIAGARINGSSEGTIKLSGATATIKESTNESQVGMELVSADRWKSFYFTVFC